MTRATIVDTDANGNRLVVPNRGPLDLATTIKQDGAAVNLTGETVTATVRAERDPDTVIDASLEDHAVAITTPASGLATLSLTDAEKQLLAVPPDPWDVYAYLIAFKLASEPFFPYLVRIYVHGVLD